MLNNMLNNTIGFFQHIRLVDFVDIGVIALFIYLVLLWFKKARARFMLIGMLIIGSIYVLARIFGLYLTTVVLQAFFAIVLFIIVVIFQDEFRHFFERIAILGISRTYGKKSEFDQNKDIDILCSALANLSRKQVGALVAIRGRDPLERHIEAGNNLDGLLSQVLLESIFDPHVPSHDGAVIIEGVRITKFGVHLPLSTNVQQISHLGTRHAAALGLAERTDALCIVISEERGTISVAEGDKIKELHDIAELCRFLDNFYRRRFLKRSKSPLLDFVTGHFLEKIIAIILACGMWVAFGHRIETIRRDFVIPIEYRNLAADKIISEPKPKEVNITLSGSERAFNLVELKDLKLSLDMSDVKEGENSFLITKDLIRYPSKFSLVNIDPDEIRLVVYRMISRNIPVELKTDGRPSPGVTVREIKVEPKEIPVIVSSLIPPEKISISTEPINLKTVVESVTLTPKLIVTPELRFPDNKYPEVKVIIDVEKK